MSDIQIYISKQSREQLEKIDPELLNYLDILNAVNQRDTNWQWSNEQGPSQWHTKR
jgi:hypothetical protein